MEGLHAFALGVVLGAFGCVIFVWIGLVALYRHFLRL